MSDSDDPPPPLPSSPPPPPMEGTEPEGPRKVRKSSEKFKSLQKMISGSAGMYTSPKSSSPPPAPPPSKKPALDTEEPISESPKLVHATKSRPKRKVRLPSRGSIGGDADRDREPNASPSLERTQELGEERIDDERSSEEPPPSIPSSAPPKIPTEPPPIPPLEATEPTINQQDSTHSRVSDKTESKTKLVEIPEPEASLNTRPVTSTPVESKAIVIGSFSDRLKKLREKRVSKPSTPTSPLSPVTPTSPLTTLESSQGPSSNRVSPLRLSSSIDKTPTSSFDHPNEYSNSPQNPGDVSSKYSPPPDSTRAPSFTFSVEPSNKKVTEESDKLDETFENESDEFDDELPPAPPPPIPDLPPPPEESETDVTPLSTTLARPVKVVAKVSFRTLERKDAWTRKSEQLQLDSLKSNALPLLGSSQNSSPKVDSKASKPSPTLTQSPIDRILPQITKQQDNTSFKDSSESLPSLPDSLPPDLPDAPPPGLPNNLSHMTPTSSSESIEVSPVIPESSSEHVEELNNENSIESKHSSPSQKVFETFNQPSLQVTEHSTPVALNTKASSKDNTVQLRQKKSPSSAETKVNRRSAFDALVTVEPTAKEKAEPKLTLQERRKLTIMASRNSSADVKVVQSLWNKQTSSSKSEEEMRVSSTPNILGDEGELSHKEPREVSSSVTELSTAEYKNFPEVTPPRNGLESTQNHISQSNDHQYRHSLPPGSESFKQIRVISEGTPPSSPDVKFTRITKEKWSKSPKSRSSQKKLLAEDDLSASASTGDIIADSRSSHKKKKKPSGLQKASSLHSFGSSSESLKTGFALPWSKSKKTSSKKEKRPHPISPLAAVTVGSQPSSDIPNSPTTISFESDDSNKTSPTQLTHSQKFFSQDIFEKQAKRKSAGLYNSIFSNSPTQTPTTFDGSQDNLSTISKEDQPFPGRDLQQEEIIEQQLAKVKEQGKMTLELLKIDPLALMRRLTPRGSPMSLRPASMILGTDIYKIDPSQWSVVQVCKWLELVGLGSFREVFKENEIAGKSLLQMDVQLFDELGIDSPEIREIFLAKIYELSNPSSSMGGLEDDFQLTVDAYTSDDWKKLEAAVNALKSPVLDDTIELEPSAIGQFIHTDYVRSQSTPNIAELDLDEELPHHNNTSGPSHEYRIRPTRTIHSFRNYNSTADPNAQVRKRQDSDISSTSQQYPSSIDSPPYFSPSGQTDVSVVHSHDVDGTKMTNEWVAGLPGGNVRSRKRALTEPSLPMNQVILEPRRTSAAPKAKTLPRQSQVSQRGEASSAEVTKRKLFKKKSLTPRQLSIQEEPATAQTNLESKFSTSSSASGQCLLKLFMNTVQEGALYKSFLVGPSTTTEDLIAMALEKANLDEEHSPQYYTIWDRDSDRTNRSSSNCQLKASEYPMKIQSQWPQANSRYFELRLKEGIYLHPSPRRRKESALPDTTAFEIQIQSLMGEKNSLLQQLDTFHSELQGKEELEKKSESLTQELVSVKAELKSQHITHNRVFADLQGDMDQLTLTKTKLEDELAVFSADSSGSEPIEILIEIQSKYTEEVESLRKELSERETLLEETRAKQTSLEEELTALQETSTELQKMSRLLKEHKQQLKTMDQKLAEKEETIHSLRVELDKTEASTKHAVALQQTLQAVETASKQQQDLSNRTARELKEQVSRLTAEVGRKEQLVVSLKKERDRLTRERQTKDNITTSLEADLASYKAIQSSNMNETERILTLQRSLSVHEVALASLQSEYETQTRDLKEAEKEVSKLRDALAKKEEQLALLSSSEEHHSRSSLYSLLDNKTAHRLISAEVVLKENSLDAKEGESKQAAGVERSLSQCFGIKVSGLLGYCVVSEVSEEASAAGIQAGDRLLEINDTNVAGKTQREINTIFKKQSQSQGGILRLVAARPIETESEDFDGLSRLGSSNEKLIERYKNLNASLSNQLDSQTAEVDKWRKECERLKAEILKYSTLKKDKDSEFAFLQASVQDLKTQLEDSEKDRAQLRDTLDKLNDSVSQQVLKEKLREKERELLSLMETAEKTMKERLKKLESENKRVMAILRSHLVTNEPIEEPYSSTGDLTAASRDELAVRLAKTEEEFAKHKSYLEQVLTIIVEEQPNLLVKIGEAQRMRDQANDTDTYGDSWC